MAVRRGCLVLPGTSTCPRLRLAAHPGRGPPGSCCGSCEAPLQTCSRTGRAPGRPAATRGPPAAHRCEPWAASSAHPGSSAWSLEKRTGPLPGPGRRGRCEGQKSPPSDPNNHHHTLATVSRPPPLAGASTWLPVPHGYPRLTLLADSLLKVHTSLLPAFLLLGTAQVWGQQEGSKATGNSSAALPPYPTAQPPRPWIWILS